MSKAMDNFIDIESYQKGYKEGFNKALEQYRDELQLAHDCRPVQILMPTNDALVERVKELEEALQKICDHKNEADKMYLYAERAERLLNEGRKSSERD